MSDIVFVDITVVDIAVVDITVVDILGTDAQKLRPTTRYAYFSVLTVRSFTQQQRDQALLQTRR